MAYTCDLATLINDGACYACLSPVQKKAALVYLGVLELAALGGTDYDNATFPADLVSDAQAFLRVKGTIEMWDSQLLTAYVSIAANNVTEAGGTVPAIDEWEPKLNLLLQARNLDILLLYITCSLGVHATK